MAPLPQSTITPPTVAAIYAAYEAANEHYDSLGISVGELGNECDRALWYGLRWASQPEQIDGRKLSIFRTGDVWEERLVEDLRAIGVEVTGQQDRIRLVAGHVRGKIDGRGTGLPEAPKTEHLMEFKSSNDKNFRDLKRHGVRKSKPLHFVQLQLGMHAFGLSRGGYMVVNKNDDERYFERVEYDAEFCLRLLARAEHIIRSDDPPSRLHDDPESKAAFVCRFCKHRAVCHEGKRARVTCRSCIHAQPEFTGDGHWSCARWNKPLGLDEQRQACPAHLFLPGLIDGEQIDVDEEAETITYRMRDGSVWVDGGEKGAADVAA